MAAASAASRGQVVGSLICQKDSYRRSFEAEVVSCVPLIPGTAEQIASRSRPKKPGTSAGTSDINNGKIASNPRWLVEFSDSVLFPEGGGQPSDHGKLTLLGDDPIEAINVEHVERQGLQCVVHSPRPLDTGTLVRQEVDFDRRWDLMQQHTGQHLVTAVMNSYDNLPTLGWGMGAGGEMSYVDLPRKPTEEELKAIQRRANEVIQQDIKITVETSDDANVDKLPDDYDKDKGVIRVIKIGELDNNTCCGTHLQQTSHIGLILMGSNQAQSGGRLRQYFIAGNRAIQLASSSIHSVRSISQLLTSNGSPDDLFDKVTRMQDSIASFKKREAKLIADIAKYEIDRVKTTLAQGNNAFAHRPEPGMDFVNIVAAGVKDQINEGHVVVLASGDGPKGGAILIVGGKDLVESYVGKVKDLFPAIKGGGKGERWQGKMTEWKSGDLEALQKLIEQ